ncbi:proline dehydrogenase family protein [Mucilaginibacter myungsuensis]|uniref:Proline dehydrogenase family protein n=1 Tax=Mucilaginibacter myungsuensis TaxID=649104 RepID=A0A929KX17_9SPHI|nr:proline dehydrogenase family protein [Mucilaginibacter myungsuensis]MBE9663219.1 proline dehydrogenase family protein [Mucilaginibacter myungsuensis]MDN3598852.1 proline dehydrogenase family protein [Mucilaginibacter myungsuensis]
MLSSNIDPAPTKGKLSFDNTEVAFRHSSNTDLKRAYWLFRAINVNFLVKVGPPMTNFAMNIGLPIKGLIKATIFKQFCGGETISECDGTIKNLSSGKVGTILDYSVEGEDDEQVFDETRDEIIRTIIRATGDPAVPITVFKVTGVGRFGLLEKLDAKETLTADEEQEWQKVQARVKAICDKAYNAGVPVMIDAEESWIQETIDLLALNMMRAYNKDKIIVYNTYQLYRHDKLASLKADYAIAEQEGFILGAKLVRGAYMEKERKRAAERGYTSPIQPNKASSDRDYDDAVRFSVQHIDKLAIVVGTHNENSCKLLADLLDEQKIPHNHPHVYCSQLLGMSDNLSFNLANAGYNVAKYVPYGPVKAVLPYLFRRAQENTAIAGQMSRELGLIMKEKTRRGV